MKIPATRVERALKVFEAHGIDLDNSKPGGGPRHWFAGPFSPTMKGVRELEMVAAYLELACDGEDPNGT